jgi:PIN domain nuclease of toxin-antitoxin system
MVTFVFDSSALLRFLHDEAGAPRVKQILSGSRTGTCRTAISAINWGEVIGITAKKQGRAAADVLDRLFANYGLEIVSVTSQRASRSAFIKLARKIAYTDAFCVELAGDSPEHVLVTADFGIKPAEQDVSIEFLPTKP